MATMLSNSELMSKVVNSLCKEGKYDEAIEQVIKANGYGLVSGDTAVGFIDEIQTKRKAGV